MYHDTGLVVDGVYRDTGLVVDGVYLDTGLVVCLVTHNTTECTVNIRLYSLLCHVSPSRCSIRPGLGHTKCGAAGW